MARRFCGNVRLYIEYNDLDCQYKVRLVTNEGRHTVYVREPAYLEHAVDSYNAFDDVARAAISFALHDADLNQDHDIGLEDALDYNTNEGEWDIRRSV